MSESESGELNAESEALGDVFFQGSAEEIRTRLKLQSEEAVARSELAAATGISDPDVLAELAGLGIRVDTLAALTLIPLIDVAWSDGVMDDKEREAVLTAAASLGSEPGSFSHRLLDIWMQEQPPPDMTVAWQAFIKALCDTLSTDESNKLAHNLLSRARDVAAAAGTHLNRSPHISAEEEACLQSLATAFPGEG